MGTNKRNGIIRTGDRDVIRLRVQDALSNDGTSDTLVAAVLAILINEATDSASIDLIQDDGSLVRAFTRHADGDKQNVLIKERADHPLAMTSSYGYPRVIKTGKSQFIPGVSDRIAGRLFPEAELILDGLAVRSYICVPLVARGHILGALTLLTSGTGRSFDGDDLLFFEEIATLIAESMRGGSR